jgi:branched-chain amino acid transport system ATP-binding protein
MDEPDRRMGPGERNELMALTGALAREQGIGVLFTEHSMDVVFAHADRMIVLARGELIAAGEPQTVRDDPKVQEVYLGRGSTFTASAGLRPGRRSGRPRRARLRRMDRAVGRSAREAGGMPAMLEVVGLDAWYGKAQILRGVSLQVNAGECVALMGPQRRRQVDDDEGHHGADTTACRPRPLARPGDLGAASVPHQPARPRLGPRDRRVFTDLSVRENLAIGRQPRREGRAVLDEARVSTLFPNLGTMPDRLGGQMSGGEQQMLTIARTLMGNPYLILLDEPAEGVAPVIVEQMVQMILTLKQEGLSVLLSEQNLHFARLVSDRAVVLEKGQVRYAGSIEALAGRCGGDPAQLSGCLKGAYGVKTGEYSNDRWTMVVLFGPPIAGWTQSRTGPRCSVGTIIGTTPAVCSPVATPRARSSGPPDLDEAAGVEGVPVQAVAVETRCPSRPG